MKKSIQFVLMVLVVTMSVVACGAGVPRVPTVKPLGHPLGQPFAANICPPSLAFSADGKILASGASHGTIILWDMKTHQPLGQPLAGHFCTPSLAFSADGEILASEASNRTIILWDMKTHQPIGQPLPGSINLTNLAFSPDGKTFATGGFAGVSHYGNGTIILWDLNTHQPIGQPLKESTGFLTSLALSPDGRMMAWGDIGSISFWDVNSHQPIGQPLNGNTHLLESIAFSADGKTLASVGDEGIILWDVNTHQRLQQPPREYPGFWDIKGVLSSDGKTFITWSCIEYDITGGCKKGITLLDDAAKRPLGQLVNADGGAVGGKVALSPDGKTAAAGNPDGTILLWDLSQITESAR